MTIPSLRTALRPPPLPSQPDAIPDSASVYVEARETARLEPPNLRGLVYRQAADGKVEVLKESGQTVDTLPADIPAGAVKNNRVLLYVDGITQDWNEQRRQIAYFLHGQADTGADVGQDVIGIHEGAGQSAQDDIKRIAKVVSLMKSVQTHAVPLGWASKQLFRIDPSVKAVHDEVKQSILAGRQVQIVTHSGGGAETAAALTLLAREGFREKIAADVRILSCASATAARDFQRAGVQEENLYYTGSRKDPVYAICRNDLSPWNPVAGVKFVYNAARYLLSRDHPDPNELVYHSPDYLFAHNVDDQGQRMQRFLDGGPGGSYPLESSAR